MWLSDLFKKHPKTMLIAAILLYFLAQSLAWFQINGQFVYTWCRDHIFLMSLIGVPISYLFIKATDLTGYGMLCTFNGLGVEAMTCTLEFKKNSEDICITGSFDACAGL